MILRDVYLYPDLVEFNGHPRLGQFRDRTRCLCHFVGKRVAREKFNASFGRICVIGKSSPGAACFVNTSKVLVVDVPLTTADFGKLDDAQPNDYFIDLLRLGLDKVAGQQEIPLAAFNAGIDAFRAGGYRNEWVWKKKRPRGLGLTLSFDCNLTMDRFQLWMRVYRKDQMVLEDRVLETAPDEIVFVPNFKRLEIVGTNVSVLAHSGLPVYSRDLSPLVHQAGHDQAPIRPPA